MNKNRLNKQFVTLVSSLFVILAMMTLSNDAYSAESHSLQDIADTAKNFVIEQMKNTDDEIEVIVGRLDPRLKLNQCSMPLEAYRQNYERQQSISTVGVRCNDHKPWSLYVPVSVKNYKLVATLKHSVVRNTVLTSEDISLVKMNINRLSSGYFDNLSKLDGKVLTQNLSKGAVLTQHHIKSQDAISRGQSVTLIAKNSVIEVRMKGIAMSKGAVGERIKVKNTKSNRIIEGTIIDKHLISVNL